MNLQFAPDWPVRCEFKFIMSLPLFGPRQNAIGVVETRFRADGAKTCNNVGVLGIDNPRRMAECPLPSVPVPNAAVPKCTCAKCPCVECPCAECPSAKCPCSEYW